MSDSLGRLYQSVIAARDLDPSVSCTARLFQRGPDKMAKKVAEEAIEVVIDAINGKTDAVIRESADLLYNLTVLWAAAGVRPDDVWREMERREDLLGIAEKMPKSPVKVPTSRVVRRPIRSLEDRALRKRYYGPPGSPRNKHAALRADLTFADCWVTSSAVLVGPRPHESPIR